MTARQLRIMYVEDEEDIREIARISLETVGGFSVDLCGSGPAAIERAPKFRPDIIIIDMMMPGMDGIETMQALKKLRQLDDIPMVFMTAKIQQSEIDYYLAAGASAVVPKPFDPMTLPGRILAIWRQHNYFDPAQSDNLSSAAPPPISFTEPTDVR